MSKELFLKVGTTAHEVQWKQVHGGLVSGASMAIAVRAQKKLNKFFGFGEVLNKVTPYMMSEDGKDIPYEIAVKVALAAGDLDMTDFMRTQKSEKELEREDPDYVDICLSAYCDIIAGCLDFKAMGLEPMESTAIAESFPYETIKEVANDFLFFAKLKETPSTSLEGSGVSQDLTTPTTPTKKDIRVKRKP